jgi:hypothetical protein
MQSPLSRQLLARNAGLISYVLASLLVLPVTCYIGQRQLQSCCYLNDSFQHGEDALLKALDVPFYQPAIFVADVLFFTAFFLIIYKSLLRERDSHPWLLLATALVVRTAEVVLIGGNVPPVELAGSCKFFHFQGLSDLVYHSFMTYFSEDLMCGDFVTSGHTIFFLIPFMTALRKGDYQSWTFPIATVCAVVGPVAIVVCRYHYVSEILQAIFLLLLIETVLLSRQQKSATVTNSKLTVKLRSDRSCCTALLQRTHLF